jgi:hypothetical protein
LAGGPTGKRSRRFAPVALAIASILLLTATWVPGAGAEWIYLIVTPLFPVLIIALAVERRACVPLLLRVTLLVLGFLLVLSSVAIRLLDAGSASMWVMGLPLSAIVMALGLVLLPLLLVGFGFAATFDPALPSSKAGTRAVAKDR